jgi:hypothetical protein
VGKNVDVSQEIEDAARRVGSLDGMVRAWQGRLEMATYGAERFEEGIRLAGKLERLLPAHSVALGRVLTEKGWILHYCARWASAERTASKAAACLRGSRSWKDLGSVENLIGSIRMRQRRLDEARRHLRRALTYWRRAGELFRVSRYHNNVGNVDYLQGRFRAALRHYRIGLEQASRLMDRLPMAYLQVNLAATLLHLGRVEESLSASEAARDLARQMGERFLEVDALSNQAWALLLLGRHKECAVRLRTVVRLARGLGEPRSITAARLMQCHRAAMHDRPRRVLEIVRRVATHEDLPVGRSHKVLFAALEGWASDVLGDRHRASDRFRRARRGLRRGTDPDVPGVVDFYQGRACAARGQRTRARKYFQHAEDHLRTGHRGWLPLARHELRKLGA